MCVTQSGLPSLIAWFQHAIDTQLYATNSYDPDPTDRMSMVSRHQASFGG